MLEAVRFLERLGLLVLGQGDDELLQSARSDLEALRLAEPSSDFLLTADGAMWGRRPLELSDAAWMEPLRGSGLVVLAPPNDEAGFRAWVEQLAAQAGVAAASGEGSASERARELVGAIAAGEAPEAPVGAAAAEMAEAAPPIPVAPPSAPVSEPMPTAVAPPAPSPALEAAPTVTPQAAESPPTGPAPRSVQAEADRVWRLHEAASHGTFALFAEVESLARDLVAVLDEPTLVAVPRVISTLDEYTTVHSLNTGMLAMRLARHLAFAEKDMMAAGVAGLLHDIGKTRLGDLPSVSREMLSADERMVLKGHTGEGARLLLDAGDGFQQAAIVAYEHHMTWQGEGGYPARHFDRPTHPLSRIVAVCDAYDVLRTERSFRPALDREAALAYLHLIGGKTLDPDLVTAFVDLATAPLPRVEMPGARPPAQSHEIGWLPETGYDPDCEPRPVRL